MRPEGDLFRMTENETAPAAAPIPDAVPVTEAPAVEASPAPEETPAPEWPTWEDDESTTTLLLRALSTLVAGGFLAWAQYQGPASWGGQTIGARWSQWVGLSIVANLVLPLGIIWMFFGQGITRPEWLKEQRYNAWNYGWDFKEWRRHLKLALIMFVVMLPFLWFASRDPNAQAYYRNVYFPPVTGVQSFAWLMLTLIIYMFCWEWFFRGFLLFGTAQGLGSIAAIILQAVAFGAVHYGKPPSELASAFAGGLVLGIVAWRERSFAPAFYTHALVHLTWAGFIYI